MSNYWYKLRKNKGKQRQSSTDHYICNVDNIDNVVPKVLEELLLELRMERFREVEDYINLKEKLKDNFPSYFYEQYKGHTLEHMASLYEVSLMYDIYNVRLAPNCRKCTETFQDKCVHTYSMP